MWWKSGRAWSFDSCLSMKGDFCLSLSLWCPLGQNFHLSLPSLGATSRVADSSIASYHQTVLNLHDLSKKSFSNGRAASTKSNGQMIAFITDPLIYVPFTDCKVMSAPGLLMTSHQKSSCRLFHDTMIYNVYLWLQGKVRSRLVDKKKCADYLTLSHTAYPTGSFLPEFLTSSCSKLAMKDVEFLAISKPWICHTLHAWKVG